MSKGTQFTGTGVAMITPFSDDGSVNYDQLEKHIDTLISKGVNYLVVLGTTAETPTLSNKEKIEIIRVAKNAISGRVPMVVGAGGNSTESVIQWIKTIGSDGIDAYLSVVPYYNKPSQLGMKQHFSAIASSADVPLMLYNVPGRTSSNITAETTLELAHELEESILAVKEASGDFTQIMKIIKDKPEGFSVVSGDDAITLPMLASGASGVVSVIGNAFPAEFSSMVTHALEGKYEEARNIHYRLLPFIELIFQEGNPTGVKALMEELGGGRSNLRLPLIPASESLTKALHLQLQNF